MKVLALVLAFGGIVGAAAVTQAQTASAPSDPLTDAQGVFGQIVGEAFHRPDPIIAADPGPGKAIGGLMRSSLEVGGAPFAAIVKPFADADAAASPAPVAQPAPRHIRHARARRHPAAKQG